MKNINLFDTTLRDGDQAIGYALDAKAKAYIFKLLEKNNLNTIEIGLASSACHKELVDLISNINCETNTQICLLCRLNNNDIKISTDVLKNFCKPRIQLLGVGSYIHLYKKLNMTESELFSLYTKSIETIKTIYNGEISIILEDASRGEVNFINKQVDFFLKQGINKISFADTVGLMTPTQVKNKFYKIKSAFGTDLTHVYKKPV